MYVLGIDLGTTFTAAATWRDGHAEIASLGSRAAVIPSVVLLREDETVLTGETAHRRGLTEPHRVSREFKRRLGDTTPILLGGVPYSAEALMGRLLRSVVDDVAAREGAQPSAICVSHPANWGPYKKDLLAQAVRLSSIDQPVTLTTEPEAAAVFYAQQQRVEPGAVVAVYDLGGGTFDAAVLRKTTAGFEILGQPEGIERLGGIDFDAAVFNHVRQALGRKLDELDEDDPTVIGAVARLREECIAAKEVLSSDTDASIPVLLPNISTEIRLTRAELEAMVRPTLHSTIDALRRALRSAGVAPEQLHSVLLVGGSSRMPLVSQLVSAELGRPVAVDAHPKHAVALGAAWLASGAATGPGPAGAAGPGPAGEPTLPAGGPPSGRPGRAAGAAVAGAAGAVAGAAAVGAGAAAARPSGPPATDQRPGDPRSTYAGTATVPAFGAAREPHQDRGPTSPPASSTTGTTPRYTYGRPTPPERVAAPVRAATAGAAAAGYASAAAAPPPPGGSRTGSGSKRRLLLVAGTAVALVLAGATVAWAVNRDTADRDPGGDGGSVESPEASRGPTEPPLPADEQCTDAIQSNERWVCLTSAVMEGGQLIIDYEVEWGDDTPNKTDGYHLHLYGAEDGGNPSEETMGNQYEPSDGRGDWLIEDLPSPLTYPADHQLVTSIIGDSPKVCARIANGTHGLVAHQAGAGYGTGNCTTIQQ